MVKFLLVSFLRVYAAALEEGQDVPTPGQAYDKNLSFFDSISCEALDKREKQQRQQNQGGDQDEQDRRAAQRQHNRALDVDTFGEGAANPNPRYYNGRRGGRGRGRGRGGYGRDAIGGGRGGRGGGPRTWNQRNKEEVAAS